MSNKKRKPADKGLLFNEILFLICLATLLWGFIYYFHNILSISGIFGELFLWLFKKLEFAFIVAPFSGYLFIKANKFNDGFKRFSMSIIGVGLLIGAICIRILYVSP